MSEFFIDVVSDAVCPWCFVGKRRLEAALTESDAADVRVRWRPFQLDATIPAEGLDRKTYMNAKFRDPARLAEAHARLKALGAEVGIAFDFDAEAFGAQDKLVERLFSLYFEQGRDIGDRDVLAAAAADCGLDAAAAREWLERGDDADDVRAEIEHAQRIGVSGVPFFIFANRLAVSGAQSSDVLSRAMDEARLEGAKTATA